MPRATVHVCSRCGLHSGQWHGRGPGCGAWNTLAEEPVAGATRSGPPARGGARARGAPPVPLPLSEVGATPLTRMPSGLGELDRVLGGGIVPGSLVLLGGSPGIGKSTLTNMVLGNLHEAAHRTLYVSGEESAEQVRLRAERLAPGALGVPVLAETDLEQILAVLAAQQPQV